MADPQSFPTVLALALLVLPSLEANPSLPPGTHLEVRLRHGIDTYTAHTGDRVEATLVAPVLVGSNIVVPAGSLLTGSITTLHRVGIGLIRERASITVQFNELTIPNHDPIPISARIFRIENARERLDRSGRIQGIRSTNTPGFQAASVLTSLAAVDPIALLFSTTAFSSTLRFSDPEIHWRAGAELILELRCELTTPFSEPLVNTPIAKDPQERAELQSLVGRLPYRTARLTDDKPSDITNVLLIGRPEAIARAFAAAGWVEAMPSNASTRYRSLRAFAETQSYTEAPMSALTLAGESAMLTLSKTLNTFTRRHHLRLYSWNESWDGLPIFQAAATHDTAIVMNLRQRSITHEIDSNIDDERAKVINDLLFTGCVEAAESMARGWIPRDLRNGSGQPLSTDRNVAVLRFNDCTQPNSGGVNLGPPILFRSSLFERTARHAMLRIRNDVIRGNLVWQTASWAYRLRQLMAKNKPAPPQYTRVSLLAQPVEALAASSESEDGSSMIAPLKERPHGNPSISTSDWTTPTVELGFTLGYSLFCKSTVGEEAWIFTKLPTPNGHVITASLTAGNQIRPGFAMGGSVTVHSNRWISNELGFHYLRGTFLLGLQKIRSGEAEPINGLVEQRAGLLTRQFSYNTVVNMRPIENRFRPYIAAGPALQLVHLTDAPFRDSKGVYRIGLSNVGMIRAAYNFSSAPPLQGGGIFQPGVQFGGGLKYRFQNCWIFRLDYRSTLSRRPDLLRKSFADIVDDVEPLPNVRTHQWFAQQRVSVGFSFTF